MLEIIDSYLLNKDITSWYETIAEDYQDYYNPVFDIRIKLEFVDNDFLTSVHRANNIIVAVYTFELYSKKNDEQILDHLLKMVWENINQNN
jgi:hypothetical protein